jgi:hypothetical protein
MVNEALIKVVESVVSAEGRAVARRRLTSSAEYIELEATGFADLLASSVSVDVASASIFVGGNPVGVAALAVVSSGGLYTYPTVPSENLSGPPFLSSLYLGEEVPGATYRYVELGIPYVDDPYVDVGIMESDVRLALELYGLELALRTPYGYVVVDGPLLPSARYVGSGYWSDELALYARRRAELVSRAAAEGKVVVGVVKRVRAETLGVAGTGRAVAVGPEVTRGGIDVYSYYIALPHESSTYVLAKVELPKAVVESLGSRGVRELLSKLYTASSSLGIPVPYGLYTADKISKSLVKRILELIELTARSRGLLAVFSGGTYE